MVAFSIVFLLALSILMPLPTLIRIVFIFGVSPGHDLALISTRGSTNHVCFSSSVLFISPLFSPVKLSFDFSFDRVFFVTVLIHKSFCIVLYCSQHLLPCRAQGWFSIPCQTLFATAHFLLNKVQIGSALEYWIHVWGESFVYPSLFLFGFDEKSIWSLISNLQSLAHGREVIALPLFQCY